MLNILTGIFIAIVGIFFILGVLAVRGTIYVWLFFLSVLTITLQLTNQISIVSSVVLWSAILIVLLLSQKTIRQAILSKNILQSFKNKVVDIDSLDKAIMFAINPWFESNILNGKLHLDTLLQLEDPQLNPREQVFLNNQVNILCQMLNDSDLSLSKPHLSPQIWEYLKQHKFLSMAIPLEYGGLGFSWVAIAEIIQKIATRSLSVAIHVMTTNSLGPQELLLKYGTKLQKEEYLPQLAAGYHVPAFAIHSNTDHEDLNLMPDNGVICHGKYQDKDILGICLNWDKSYVILGPIATLICVIVKLYDPNNLLVGTEKDLGLTVFLIPANFTGVNHSTQYLSMNQTHLMGPVRGKNVFVPFDFILGGKDMIGQGSLMLNQCLSIARGVGLSSLGTAIGKLNFKDITAYYQVSKKSLLPMLDFNATEPRVAKIAGYAYMLDSMYKFTLIGFNMGYNSGILTAMSKCYITEIARKMINILMDVYGNRASLLGINNSLSKIYKTIPSSIVMDGSNNFLQSRMMLQSGVAKCHPFLSSTIQALHSDQVKIFDQHLFAYISYILSNFARMILHAISNKIFCSTTTVTRINKKIKKYCKGLNFFSIVLACLLEVSLFEFGLLFKNNERMSARLTNIWSYISIGCAVIKQHSKNIDDVDENIIVTWCLKNCLYNIQKTIIELLENFPNKMLAKCLSMIIFPFGKKYKSQDDFLTDQIISVINKNTTIRSKLMDNCYMASDDNLEIAFKKILNIAPLSRKIVLAEKSGVIPKNIDLNTSLNLAMQEKILTELEANLIKEAELAIDNALHLDEFNINSL